MVIKAKVPQLSTPKAGVRVVSPRIMEIRPKMPGVPRTWSPSSITRRFGRGSVAWSNPK